VDIEAEKSRNSPLSEKWNEGNRVKSEGNRVKKKGESSTAGKQSRIIKTYKSEVQRSSTSLQVKDKKGVNRKDIGKTLREINKGEKVYWNIELVIWVRNPQITGSKRQKEG
jgi:hypothetical protein